MSLEWESPTPSPIHTHTPHTTILLHFPSRLFSNSLTLTRGGHRHWQVGRKQDNDLIPHIRSKGVKDHTFSKNRRKRSCPLLQSVSIVDDTDSRDQIFHFQWKKHRALYHDFSKGLSEVSYNYSGGVPPIPRLFQRSKIVSRNRTILPFF